MGMYGQQPPYGQQPMYGQPPTYGQQPMYGQQPPLGHTAPAPNLLQQTGAHQGGMSTGAKVAMAAAGGLALGVGGMYLAENMDDVGDALGGAGGWLEDRGEDVMGFF